MPDEADGVIRGCQVQKHLGTMKADLKMVGTFPMANERLKRSVTNGTSNSALSLSTQVGSRSLEQYLSGRACMAAATSALVSIRKELSKQ